VNKEPKRGQLWQETRWGGLYSPEQHLFWYIIDDPLDYQYGYTIYSILLNYTDVFSSTSAENIPTRVFRQNNWKLICEE
jgi:hypothetical protein